MSDLIERAAQDLARSENVAALTGAGISVESNIPPFRGKGGLWEKIDPMEYAHIDAFRRDPAKVWKVLIKGMKDVIDQARPNAAHDGLARLEALDRLHTIITQNVDGLHQMAGSSDVIEFHGSFAWQLVVPKLEGDIYLDWPRAGMCSPATVEGDRVYTVTNRDEVVCLDLYGLANGNDGPFRELAIDWCFTGSAADHCRVTVELAFAMRPGLQSGALRLLLETGSSQLLPLFARRARTLYSQDA